MRQRWTVRAVICAAALGLAAALGAAPNASSATPPRGPDPSNQVVVVAVPGLQWSDITSTVTPHLWGFARSGARGLLAVKAADGVARCGAAMTTLGAGNRSRASSSIDALCTRSPSASGAPALTADQWAGLVRANAHQRFGTRPGSLGAALLRRGSAVNLVGAAGVNLAVGPNVARVDGTVGAALILVEDAGVYDASGAQRVEQLRAMDRRLADHLVTPPGVTTLLVGAGDGARGGAGLRVAVAAGPGFAPGRLVSDSTGRAPYVELIDVAPTVLRALSVPVPSDMAGTPWRADAGSVSISSLVDATDHARERRVLGGGFVSGLVAVTSVLALVALAGLRQRRTAPRIARVVEPLCYVVAALPVASYALNVLPWWRWAPVVVMLAVLGAAAVIAAAAIVAARGWPPWGGAVVVTGSAAVVLAVDFMTGTHLQLDSLLGDSTVIAGRFHGAGNTAFAVFATASLVSAGAAAAALRPRGRPIAVAGAGVLGIAAVVIDGAPGLGDDFGGVLALAPAVVVLLVMTREVRVGRNVWIAAFGAGVAVGVTLLGYDIAAGGGHIGRFAEGGGHGARTTLDRRLAAMLESWHTSPYVVLVIVTVAVVALVVLRYDPRDALADRPALRGGLVAVGVCAVLGGLLNDSGAVVTGAAAVVGLPVFLGGVLRARG